MPSLQETIQRFQADRRDLETCYPSPFSPFRNQRFTEFYASWQESAEALVYDESDPDERADAYLFCRLLQRTRRIHDEWRASLAGLYAILPFLEPLHALADDLGRMIFIEGEDAGGALDAIARATAVCAATMSSDTEGFDFWGTRLPEVLNDADVRLKTWTTFYGGYDPTFDWWVRAPLEEYKKALAELKGRVTASLDAELSQVRAAMPPVGREALVRSLSEECVGYSPEELVKIAENHYRLCEGEMRRAAHELGFDDWRLALEHCKNLNVPPGQQSHLILGMLKEAIAYVEERELLTVPDLAVETIQMEMMSAADQKVNPFFLGGEKIIVSYPTSEMSHAEKRMSMRGNNPAFSRATVQHELIPGHHMQWYAANRFRTYREPFSTPFWIEGWTLHWEMLLWDLEFPQTPEERIGMLFWRMHRCVRVVFSLGYHLGELTPSECVNMLVHRVGHERANAEAEVRRSFGGLYDPLYQVAYLIGGLMVRDMYRQWTEGGKSPKAFHDAFLSQNDINLGVMRALLFDLETSPTDDLSWKFRA